MAEYLIEKGIDKTKILIKPHSDLNLHKFKSSLFHCPQNFEIITDSFLKTIRKASIVIGQASSTTVEALQYGVPVIVVASQRGLTYNPIPENIPKTCWEFCHTSEELLIAIQKFLNVSTEEIYIRRETSNWIKDQYFESVSEEGIRSFLKLDDSIVPPENIFV